MGNLARQVHAIALEACDLSGSRSLVDVGGGHGHLAATLLGRYPEAWGRRVRSGPCRRRAEKVLADAGLGHRADTVGGDFFAAAPEWGDAYVLSMILHDWDDARAMSVMQKMEHAKPPQAVVEPDSMPWSMGWTLENLDAPTW